MVPEKYKVLLDNLYKNLSVYNFSCKMSVSKTGEITVQLGDLVQSNKVCSIIYGECELLDIYEKDLNLCRWCSVFDNADSKEYILVKKKAKINKIIDEVFDKGKSDNKEFQNILDGIKNKLKLNFYFE